MKSPQSTGARPTLAGARVAPPLPSDELGDVGEAKFKYLCALAPMVANKADRDRFGWDYVVQLAAEDAGELPLDQRATHMTSFVQVKATWRGAKSSVRLSLSSAEKLAKHQAASFIVGLAFNRNGEDDCDVHVIEMRGAALAKVLKALRSYEKRGHRAVNAATISFELDHQNRLAANTPSALKARLASSFSQGEAAYIAVKDHELNTIGFEAGRYQAVFSTTEISPFETVEFLLGQRELTGTITGPVETRFNIALPSTFIQAGEARMALRPEPIGPCRIKIRGSGLQRPVSFGGQYYYAAVAGRSGLAWKARADFDLFSIEHDPAGYRLKSAMSIDDARVHLISDWVAFQRMAVAQTVGPIHLTLRGPQLGESLTWRFPHRPEGAEDLRARLDLFETAEQVLGEVGRLGERIAARSIYSNQKAIYAAAGMSRPGARRVQIGFRRESDDQDDAEITRLYIGAIDFETFRVAHAAQVVMRPRQEPDGRYWFTGAHQFVAIEAIGIGAVDFHDFVEDAKAAAQIDDVLLDEIDAAFLNEALGEVGRF